MTERLKMTALYDRAFSNLARYVPDVPSLGEQVLAPGRANRTERNAPAVGDMVAARYGRADVRLFQ